MTETAYERLLDALHGLSLKVRTNGPVKASAQCPAHEDRAPSLSITNATGRDGAGQVLLHCHAGCQTVDILASLSLTMADLFDNRRGTEYRYDNGRTVRRRADKSGFPQSGNTVEFQLFHLSELSKPGVKGHGIFLVEGEKDVLAIEAMGGVATTAPQGSKSFHKVDVSPLAGHYVTAIVDRDAAGARWAAEVRRIVGPVAAGLRFVQAAIGKDAADHIAAIDDPHEALEGWVPFEFAAEQDPPSGGGFWDSLPILTHIHAFARARRTAPWAVLGTVLARVVCDTEPSVQLPPTIGSYASLNLFVALVGPSGSGKDSARKVAREAVDWVPMFITAPIGSGEGLSHMFMRPGGKDEPAEQYNTAALVTIGEIDTLTALVKRQSSTVAGQLRQAAMGEQLGFFYVDKDKRMMVPEHSYRLCLIVGVQPGRGAALLDDTDGGTPQRFLWMPATDPEAPDEVPDAPEPWAWKPPTWERTEEEKDFPEWRSRVLVRLCAQARDTIVAAHLARTRGTGDALDGHALLTRVKVAAALSILDGNGEVTDLYWRLSGDVMAESDATRESIGRTLAEASRRRNEQQALAEADRALVVEEKVSSAALGRVARLISRKLAGAPDGMTRREVSWSVAGRDKQWLDPALDALRAAGQITVVEEERGHRYALQGGTVGRGTSPVETHPKTIESDVQKTAGQDLDQQLGSDRAREGLHETVGQRPTVPPSERSTVLPSGRSTDVPAWVAEPSAGRQ